MAGQNLRVGGFINAGSIRRKGLAPGLTTRANASSLGLALDYLWRGNRALPMSAAHVLRGAGGGQSRLSCRCCVGDALPKRGGSAWYLNPESCCTPAAGSPRTENERQQPLLPAVQNRQRLATKKAG